MSQTRRARIGSSRPHDLSVRRMLDKREIRARRARQVHAHRLPRVQRAHARVEEETGAGARLAAVAANALLSIQPHVCQLPR